ncbi:hypothetical protein JAO76_15575 [Pontibacter sp. BT310]|uniref:Uncharacterized protein n=1 Tax=Pontibacter populi TaxID=890055 RepID=A0ABS6XG35_9BACT|nr:MULTISPECIES: hypothetical protein [Pontibacter]MBJ6119630.1 hypothetical protein [Pontibacter sp. BT310]MBR0572057.1 hypothetical protein [Microvirga sp. STS03]MBW3366483.1 hypothetical protein [Pontibacter populi]
MEETYNDVDWEALSYYRNHWQEGSQQIKNALLRVVTLAYDEAGRSAAAAMELIEEQLQMVSYDESSFQQALGKVLQEHVGIIANKQLLNPFMNLNGDYRPAYMAERFALANLTGTKPENALEWLTSLDESNERVRLLITAIYLMEVKRELQACSKSGYSSLTIKNDNNEDDNEKSDADSQVEGIGKKSNRQVLMIKPHGFPWFITPELESIKLIYQILLDEDIIEPIAVKVADITALFSKDGPQEPIQITGDIGKLVIIMRWLASNILSDAHKRPSIEDFSQGELRRFSHWLTPRMIGTFKDVNGATFTAKQISNAANRIPFEELEQSEWYKDLVERLIVAINPEKQIKSK